MFRNRQPAWPYRCTGKDARTGVFFFALRAGAARAFPAAGHARGREAAASPAANTAARRRPARGANRARKPARVPHGTAWAAASRQGTRRRGRSSARGANRARPTRACAPRDGTGGGIAGREHGGAAKAGARRRSCAPNPSGRRKTTEPCNYYHFKPYFKTLSRKSALPRSCGASNHRRLPPRAAPHPSMMKICQTQRP